MSRPGDTHGTSESPATTLRVHLLATSDLHAHVHPYNYYTDQPQETVGLARVAGLVAKLRESRENLLLFDNGDTLQGTPLGDYAAEERQQDGRPHPVLAAMGVLGYDAMTLGNHDFNFGLPFLERSLAGAPFPVVLANLRRQDGSPFLPPWTVLERRMHDSAGRLRPLRIGVIGFVPPQVTKWDRVLLSGLIVSEDILTAAEREVPLLRAQKPDLVVALCHSGIGPRTPVAEMENAASVLARMPGIDAIVAGHTHVLFPGRAPSAATPDWIDAEAGTVFGRPVVQPGAWGSHLGEIDLTLTETAECGWRVSKSRSRLHPIAAPDAGNGQPRALVPSSPAILQATAEDHMATLGFIRRRIGETEVPLESYFSMISPSAAVQLVADAQRAHAARVLAGHSMATLPLLSAASPFKCGGRGGKDNYTDIPSGPLAIKNASDLYVFPNTVHILHVSGLQVRDWLERSVSAFHQITPGSRGQTLIDPEFAGYNFDVLDGLSYEIDVTQPRRYSAEGDEWFDTPGRIRNLCHRGSEVAPGDEFLVVTNSYRAGGGGHFYSAAEADTVVAERLSVREVLIRHIRAEGRLNPKVRPDWRFAPLGDTEVIVETGSGALAHANRIAELGLTHLGQSEAGFARFSLKL